MAPSGPAVAKYGQAAMTSAYRAMLAFSFDNGWNPRLITTHVDAIRPADFTAMLAAMTPRCAAAFKAAIGKAGHHDKAAVRALQGAVFFGVTGPNGIRPVGTIGLVSSRSFSLATLGLDTGGGTDRVSISFTAKANIHLQDRRGKQYLLPTSRAVRFLLVAGGKDSSTPFLIDAWRNTMTVGKVAPV